MTKRQAEKLVDAVESVLRDWKLFRYAYDGLDTDDDALLRSELVQALLDEARRVKGDDPATEVIANATFHSGKPVSGRYEPGVGLVLEKEPADQKKAADLTVEEFSRIIQEESVKIGRGGRDEMKAAADRFREMGIRPKMHVGRGNEMNDTPEGIRLRLEWFAGQLVQMESMEEPLGVNTWVNTTEKFTRV